MRDSIVPIWKGLSPEVLETGLRVEFGSLAALKEFNAERARVLGASPETKPPAELAAPRDRLWSPMMELHYGTSCGYGDEPPVARLDIERILAHKDAMPVLLDLLRGPNPEGRVYAAEALLRLQKKGTALPEDVAKAIAWIRTAPTPIMVCRGCMHSREPAAEALDVMSGGEEEK